jgi:5-methylcytosine-specific restriction endonuclease McrBC regulatory subunit McrC
MNAALEISVPERGHCDIDSKAWEILSAQRDFWRLVDQKIVTVTHLSHKDVRLTGSCFVGRIVLDGATLEIGEKIDGSLAALLGYATYNSFRVEQYSAPSSALGPLLGLLVRHFLLVLRSYVSQGRQFRYDRKGSYGSLVGGRINVTKTVSLRARGLPHLIAFDRPILTHAILKNRILAAAISQVERVSEIIRLNEGDLGIARGLSLLFEDCKDAEVLFGDRDAFVRAAQRMVSSKEERDRDLLALASVILAHQSFEYGSTVKSVAPRAWFLNLENLFQVSVRQVLAILYQGGTVRGGSDSGLEKRIFEKIGEEYKANPDLVLSTSTEIEAIGDVKYKVWTGSPSQPDLYQLLVHAATYKARTAFLVFPHDEFAVRDLGTSATGCPTWSFGVDIRKLKEHLLAALGMMGLLTTPSNQ